MEENQKFVKKRTNNKGKTAKNEWKNDGSDFLQALYSLHKKLGQFFFHTSLLTYLN